MTASVPEKAAAMPDTSLRIMVRVLESEGLDPRPALVAAGLPDGLSETPATISGAQELAFQRAFVEITGYRPDIWVRTGGTYRLPSFGELGLALMTSSNLNEYLEVNLGTRELDFSFADVHPIEPDSESIGFAIDAAELPAELQEFSVYRDLGAIVSTLRDLWGGRAPIQRIELAAERPTRRELTILGEAVTFGAGQNTLTWDRKISSRPLRFGDPTLHEVYLASCRRRSRVRGTKDEFTDTLEKFLAAGRGGDLSLPMVAAELGVTERTLQRRLMASNLRFRDLVDEARRRVATEMLGNRDHSIAQIAFHLGYSDAIGFSHAYRRWTGISPGSIRRRSRKRA